MKRVRLSLCFLLCVCSYIMVALNFMFVISYSYLPILHIGRITRLPMTHHDWIQHEIQTFHESLNQRCALEQITKHLLCKMLCRYSANTVLPRQPRSMTKKSLLGLLDMKLKSMASLSLEERMILVWEIFMINLIQVILDIST